MAGASFTTEELSQQADRLIKTLDEAVAAGGPFAVDPDTVQNLMGLACRLYGAQINKGETYLPVGGHNAITADDALFTCSGLLEAANLSPFEFGMWKNHTGR
ncbi:MAG: hypothetical protein K2X62_08245 [Beijerinckiaceae bacterium]|jgi:hypothetical protein|nr:hypothetical protein [Beijerinckiaceae bacterium]MDO9443187.1 hypothetical protein [Beijerinckiaceae bacterium]